MGDGSSWSEPSLDAFLTKKLPRMTTPPDSSKNKADSRRLEKIREHVVTSRHRRRCIEGVILGVAVGESLGLATARHSAKDRIRRYRREVPQFRWLGRGIVAARYHGMISLGQSILRSYQDGDRFAQDIAKRQRWYVAISPLLVPTWLAGLAQIGGWKSARGKSKESHLLAGQMLLGVVLKSNVRVGRWRDASIGLFSEAPELVAAAGLLSQAARTAEVWRRDAFDATKIWNKLIESVDDPLLIEWMEKAKPDLAKNHSVVRFCRRLGWKRSVPKDPRAIALMGIYAWLVHPKRFRQSVLPIFRLDGDVTSMAAIAGGLSGIYLGAGSIPPEWRSGLANWPHGRNWRKHLVDRLSEWPHGIDDLHDAPALPSHLLRQLARNLTLQTLLLIQRAIAIVPGPSHNRKSR